MPFGIVAGIAAVGVGAYDAYESTGNADFSKGIASTQFGEQQDYAAQLDALMKDPSKVTSLPGYQFNFDQGSDAVAREMGANGMLGSGNEGIALTQYGQNFATSALTQQEQLLASLSGLQGNTSSNSSLINGSQNSTNQSFNQMGQLLASLGYSYGGMAGSGGSFGSAGSYGGYGDATSMGMPNVNASEYAGALA